MTPLALPPPLTRSGDQLEGQQICTTEGAAATKEAKRSLKPPRRKERRRGARRNSGRGPLQAPAGFLGSEGPRPANCRAPEIHQRTRIHFPLQLGGGQGHPVKRWVSSESKRLSPGEPPGAPENPFLQNHTSESLEAVVKSHQSFFFFFFYQKNKVKL